MIAGELVDVMEHRIEGYEWTCGHIGSIIGPAHILKDNFYAKEWSMKEPPIWPYMWVVQVESDTAKGGYAYANLPEKHLGPHACTTNCPPHFGMKGVQQCAI